METKLTLRVNRLTIERAKAYAREHRTSISRMVQTYLDAVTFPRDEDGGVTPLVRSLSGVIKPGGIAKPGRILK